MEVNKINIFWFRRDLRLQDNHGLYQALAGGLPVLPVFIFDSEILHKISYRHDRRVNFIYGEVLRLKYELETLGSTLIILHSTVINAFHKLLSDYPLNSVITNHDYEPEAISRDEKVALFLKEKAVGFQSFKDQVIFEKDEIVKENGKCYSVFTPYSKKWKEKLAVIYPYEYPSSDYLWNLCKIPSAPFVSLCEMGFGRRADDYPPAVINQKLLKNYHLTRDFPSQEGTSRLGIHLRFGTISIRQLVKMALETNETFLAELIWREFFMSVLFHYPSVLVSAFKPAYDFIEWKNDSHDFELWCEGKTGYPFVDAGMRELNETGFMHNRARMVAASFLAKHLLIDWRWGEAYFAGQLLDFELSSNNGNWQWAAGSGCDAAPWFRIFNPLLQAKKFDPENKYILKWIPEFGTGEYLEPIVDHEFARERCIAAYNKVLKKHEKP